MVIYLDIDGVIIPWGQSHPSEVAVEALNALVESLEAPIIVSSAWRKTRSLSELQELLRQWGVRGAVVGKTPQLSTNKAWVKGWPFVPAAIRAHEIQQDMASSRIAPHQVVVIDDLKLTPYFENQVHVIETDSLIGLTYEN